MTRPEAKAVNSRDGQWTYEAGGCGYIVDVTHRPTGRTTQVRGGISAARRMAKSGELAARFTPLVDRAEAELRRFSGQLMRADELARHLDAEEADVRDALQTLYAAGLVREHDGGPSFGYRSLWTWWCAE